MRLVHLFCLCAWLGSTTTALVFAQGPIIDSDPAPGRSPGPPVNYSWPLSAAAEVVEAERKENAKKALNTAATSSVAPHSTVLGNYNGSRAETPPARSILSSSTTATLSDEQNNLSSRSSNNSTSNRERKEVKGERQRQEPQHHQNEEINQRTRAADGRVLAGDSQSVTMPVLVANPPMNNSSASPVTINDAATPKYTPPTAAIENSPTVSADELKNPVSPRNRRSSSVANQINTTLTTTRPIELIERIGVATVQSPGLMGDDLGEMEVNLFCGDSPAERGARERSYASEPDDVLIKLPASELHGGEFASDGGGRVDSVTVITRNDDDHVSAAPPDLTTTKSGDVPSVGNESVFPGATVNPLTSYTPQSSDGEAAAAESSSSPPGAPLTTQSSSSAAHSSSSQHPVDGSASEVTWDKITRDHGVPVLVDVTHDVFDSRFGLVAGVEYRGKRGYNGLRVELFMLL